MMAASKHDELEMAKLQKKIRHQQHHSLKARNAVTKLTPAEIRSLHHGVTLSKGNSRQTSHGSTPGQGQNLISDTPPLTPENVVANHKQIVGNSNVNLPTPPQSPDTAHESRRNSNPTNGYTHVHAPKPHPYSTAQFVNRGPTSRPSSASSYRGMQTYRGPEVTRTGSLTMLRQPPPDIVSNPLSQFSRPRRSQTSTSPDRRNSRHSATSVSQDQLDMQSQPVSNGSDYSVRTTSPHKIDDSSESALELTESMGFPMIVRSNTSHDDAEVPTSESPVVADNRRAEDKPHGKAWSWRRSVGGHSPDDADFAAVKKNRRRTLSFSKQSTSTQSILYSNTKPGTAPIRMDSLRGELPSNKPNPVGDENTGELNSSSSMFSSHPGVRPLNLQIPENTEAQPVEILTAQQNVSSESKGKGREVEETPMYGRCSCCGKLKKPNGFHSELSPVIENENLRTNFNFEADKTSTVNKRRSSSVASSNRRKYTPIIPMSIGEDRTVQATIEPYPDVLVQKVGDVVASNVESVSSQPERSVDTKLVRFSSLHGKNPPSRTAQEKGTVTGSKADTTTINEHLGSSETVETLLSRPQMDTAKVVTNGFPTQSSASVLSPSLCGADGTVETQAHTSSNEPLEGQAPQESQNPTQQNPEHDLVEERKGFGERENAQEKTEPTSKETMDKGVDTNASTSKSRFRNKLKKEKTAAVAVTELTSRATPNNKAREKQWDVPDQKASAKSPQKTSAFSIFKRHRKTVSESESPTYNVPLSAATQEPVTAPKEDIISPMQPPSAHELITTPSATSPAVSTVDIEQKGMNLASIQPQRDSGTGAEKKVEVVSSVLQPDVVPQADANTTVTSTSFPSKPPESLTQIAAPQPPAVTQSENDDLPNGARSLTDVPQSSHSPNQPWPLPETQLSTTIPLETGSNETTQTIPKLSVDSEHEADLLPMPHMGPHFARSNATLRDFVIPRGKSSNNLLGAPLSKVTEDEVGGNRVANTSIYA